MLSGINLRPDYFSFNERVLVTQAALNASLFRFESGVPALRLRNELGEVVLLPFQGQQIWSAAFLGRELTMRSMFSQPQPTRDFLATFGGFMQHCGATAMGGPGSGDTHPLHGDLPNAPYQDATLLVGNDETGAFLGLTGSYEHTIAFGEHYLAQPEVRLYAGSSAVQVRMTINNLSSQPMPLMYLFHINYRPVNGSRLVYSALADPEHMRVRVNLPSHVQVKPGYREFVDRLRSQPELHLTLSPDLAYDPEVVFMIDYYADDQGWAYAMQSHPDGAADYVRHRPAQLAHGVRWICRTPDQDALGFEAGTAGVDGRAAEQAKGNLTWLAPKQSFRCDFEAGALTPNQAAQMVAHIGNILTQKSR